MYEILIVDDHTHLVDSLSHWASVGANGDFQCL